MRRRMLLGGLAAMAGLAGCGEQRSDPTAADGCPECGCPTVTYDPSDTGPNDSDADLRYNIEALNNVRYPDPADDVPGIQTEIDNLPAEGGIIYLQEGRYEVKDGDYNDGSGNPNPAIQVKNQQFSKGFAIVSDGPSAEIFLPDGITETNNGKRIIDIGTDDPTKEEPQDNVLLANFKIDGNQQNQGSIGTANDGHNILIEGSNGIVKNVHSVNATGDGVEPERHGASDTGNILIEGCFFLDNNEHDVHIHGVDGLTVWGCRMDGNADKAIVTNSTSETDVEDVLIEANAILNSGIHGVEIDSQTDNAKVRDFTLKGNLIAGHTNKGVRVRGNNFTNPHAVEVTITDNIVVNNGTDGITLDAALQTEVKDNYVARNGSNGISCINNPQKSVDVVDNYVLNNNQSDNSSRGITLFEDGGTLKDVRIADNYVVSDEDVTTKHHQGILLGSNSAGTITDVAVVGNFVKGATNDAVQAAFTPSYLYDNIPVTTDVDVRDLKAEEGNRGWHNGAGTGVEGFAYHDGSDWFYENGITEIVNAEEPQGSYQPGQIVEFKDNGDGSGNGVYYLLQDGTTWAKFSSTISI